MKMPSIDARTVAISMGCLSVSLIGAVSGLANPAGHQPNLALAAHGTIPEASERVASLYELYNEEEKSFLQQYEQRDNPAKLSDKAISKAAGRLWKGRRDADHLTLMGEPAGHDLSRKMNPLFIEFGKLAGAYRGTPRGQQLVQRIKTKLQKELPRLKKFLQQAEGGLQKGNLEIFEKLMEAKGIELHEQTIFLIASERRPYIEPFNVVMGKGDTVLRSKRKQEYMEQGKVAMSKHLAAAAEFSSEAMRIQSEIASTGAAKLGQDQTGGPAEAFAHVATLWGNASAGLVRATAIVWAFTDRPVAQTQPSPEELKKSAIASLASIIEAAAVSTPPDKVQQVYEDLLKQISVVDRRLGSFSQDVSKGCESALSRLAAKDPALSTRIESYQRATSEPLRWRKLYSFLHAKTLSQGVPTSTALLTSQSEVPSHIRPAFARPPAGNTVVGPPIFNAPASWMVHEASTRLVGRPVTEDRMIRLTPTSRSAVVPYQGNHYGNVPVAMQSAAESADLKTAVVVDDTHGPLSMEAADAVSATELQDYLVVAGPIQQVHLESLVTRYIGLPDVAYMLAPFGRTPTLPDNVSPLNQTCWRLEIKPVWAQQRYFTVVNPGMAK